MTSYQLNSKCIGKSSIFVLKKTTKIKCFVDQTFALTTAISLQCAQYQLCSFSCSIRQEQRNSYTHPHTIAILKIPVLLFPTFLKIKVQEKKKAKKEPWIPKQESSLSEITKIFQVFKAYIASQYGQCIVPSILDIQDLLPYFFCNQY